MNTSHHTQSPPPSADAPSNTNDVKTLPCPYCGRLNDARSFECDDCGGVFEPLSRQATQNAMGPWFIRDENNPFSPGCAYETLRKMVKRGRVTETSIIRGPTTNQFWMFAKHTPGVAILFGTCHGCHSPANPEDFSCGKCGAVLSPATSRGHLGLAPVAPVKNAPSSMQSSTRQTPGPSANGSLMLEGFVPASSPSDVRTMRSVDNTLSPYLDRATPARPERPSATPPSRPAQANTPAPEPTSERQQATTRRLRKQLSSARAVNIALVVLSGLLLAGLVIALVVPRMTTGASVDSNGASSTTEALGAPPDPSGSGSAGASSSEGVADVDPSSSIDEAERIAEPGTVEALEAAIALLKERRDGLSESDAGAEVIGLKIEELESKLDAIRLRETLSDGA